jgi:hypothetical protein
MCDVRPFSVIRIADPELGDRPGTDRGTEISREQDALHTRYFNMIHSNFFENAVGRSRLSPGIMHWSQLASFPLNGTFKLASCCFEDSCVV